MIHYMPFTYMSEPLTTLLTRHFSDLVVHMPMAALAPEAMLNAEKAGRLQLRFSDSIDAHQLQQAVNSFISWASLHGGKTGSLAGFFRAGQYQKRAAAEPGTSQIRSLIRNWGDTISEKEVVDPLFEAALFLVLAHQYDQQQDALDRDLSSVQAMENRFSEILGESDGPRPLGPALDAVGSNPSADRGTYMTRQRLRAWAQLAQGKVEPEGVFITTSRAVWLHVLEALGDPEVARYPMEMVQTEVFSKVRGQTDQLKTCLAQFLRENSTLPSAPQSAGDAVDPFPDQGRGISFCVVSGCSVNSLLSYFIKEIQVDGETFVPDEHQGDMILAWLAV